MKSCFCYIIWSASLKRYYIGSTRGDLKLRLKKHRSHFYGTKAFTSKAKDWEIYLKIELKDYSHALRLERKIKSMKSKIYIENLKKYPELVIKIIEETRCI